MTSARARSRARRGRPLTFDPAEVLDRAVDSFWVHGYGRATVAVLENDTGVSHSSLLNTFGPKEELFGTVLDRYQERVDEELVVPLLQGRSGLLDVATFFGRLAETAGSPPEARGCLLVNVSLERPRALPTVSSRVERYRSRLEDALTAALQRAARRGEVDDREVPQRAEVLAGLVVAIHWTSRVAGPGPGQALASSVRHTVESWLPDLPGHAP